MTGEVLYHVYSSWLASQEVVEDVRTESSFRTPGLLSGYCYNVIR